MKPLNDWLKRVTNSPTFKLEENIFIKLEHLNPTGSVKDRMIYGLLTRLIERKEINERTNIYEASSGNTGSSLALFCSILDLPLTITVPQKCSQNKILLTEKYGAKVIVCPGNRIEDEEHYQNVIKRLCQGDPNGYLINQYENELNPQSYSSLAEEIYESSEGQIDFFVASSSSGGTISGVGKYLKEKNPRIQIVLADPEGSAIAHLLNNNYPYKEVKTKIEGAGKDHISKCLDREIIDEIIQVSEEEASQRCREMLLNGFLVGWSSGVNIAAAFRIREKYGFNVKIYTLTPDAGWKYF